jgi:DNA-binding NarL/FixJ family response regulator
MRVFLVEDSPAIRERLHDVVSLVDSTQLMAEAATEHDAVQGILALRPDVVILDLTLAAGSGIEVLRKIKAALPALRVIVLTNKTEPQYRKKCMALGADRFLDKSRDFGSLHAHLSALRAGSA